MFNHISALVPNDPSRRRAIDALTRFVGYNVRWLILVAVLVSAVNAIIRTRVMPKDVDGTLPDTILILEFKPRF